MPLDDVKNVLLVLSGKGGVGKSSITTQLAFTLSLHGHSVGVLDIDLTGPSIPRFFGIEEAKVRQAPGGWIPVPVHGAQSLEGRPHIPVDTPNGSSQENDQKVGALTCMSLGFILSSRSDAVIWRGPKKTAMVRQFLSDVIWPEGLDYLLIDTPPGTSDEHISLLETLLKTCTSSQLAGAVVVTTPQAISVSDVKKELNFCRKVRIKVLGVVENMAGFVCPNCSECTNVFSKGGGEIMAREFDVPFLGSVPIDPAFVMLIEEGTRPVYPKGTVIEGKDISTDPQVNGEGRTSSKNQGLLIDKYRSCLLCPIFDGIIKRLEQDIGHTF